MSVDEITARKTAATPESALAARFQADTGRHEMTVLHDDGLYRHLRFMQPKPASSAYWFDLITWPGSLVVRGDVEGYMFTRLPDMFEFFRGEDGIHPDYWAEKLEHGRASAQTYSEELFRQHIVEYTVQAIRYGDAPRGIGKAVREEILNSEFLADEAEARAVLQQFEFQGFEFEDAWKWNLRDYTRPFLWSCHAIVWGISQYDSQRGPASVHLMTQ